MQSMKPSRRQRSLTARRHMHTIHHATSTPQLQITTHTNKPDRRRRVTPTQHTNTTALHCATAHRTSTHRAHGINTPSDRHAGPAPHSLKSGQVSQRRRDAARKLVAVQIQDPAGHILEMNGHRVTPWHPTLLAVTRHTTSPQLIASKHTADPQASCTGTMHKRHLQSVAPT
jgi:hypothetical protein